MPQSHWCPWESSGGIRAPGCRWQGPQWAGPCKGYVPAIYPAPLPPRCLCFCCFTPGPGAPSPPALSPALSVSIYQKLVVVSDLSQRSPEDLLHP